MVIYKVQCTPCVYEVMSMINYFTKTLALQKYFRPFSVETSGGLWRGLFRSIYNLQTLLTIYIIVIDNSIKSVELSCHIVLNYFLNYVRTPTYFKTIFTIKTAQNLAPRPSARFFMQHKCAKEGGCMVEIIIFCEGWFNGDFLTFWDFKYTTCVLGFKFSCSAWNTVNGFENHFVIKIYFVADVWACSVVVEHLAVNKVHTINSYCKITFIVVHFPRSLFCFPCYFWTNH